jgi:hypothetical protein
MSIDNICIHYTVFDIRLGLLKFKRSVLFNLNVYLDLYMYIL